ncbi:acetyltransferase [Candidatus Saccharibacteria bacterium]|nr:acetyltransferase [Candidatus Saccharibacteria bacterium]
MEKNIGILGAGGQSDEAESYYDKGEVLFRAVDDIYVTDDEKVTSIALAASEYGDTPVVAAVGAPALKVELIDRWAGRKYETIISKSAYIDESSSVGEGSIVAPGSIITTNVKIGKHVLVNVAATISHDTVIGDYSTISPGAHIGGRVEIGEGVFIGIGVVVMNDVKISDGVVVGAGASVINNIEQENAVAVGVPARTIRVNKGWLREI